MKRFALTSASAFLLVLAGCSDPADKVHKSATSEPQKAVAPAAAAAKEYAITEDSKVGFVGSKVTGKHDGGFKKVAGAIKVADGKVAGTSEIKIDLTSVWTDTDRLTGHLKSADFFDVQKFPQATFTATSVEAADAGLYKVTGNLDLHGVTKSITFPAKIEVGAETVKVNAEFAINRRDFNINYPGKSNDLIRDDVVIKLALNAAPGAVKL